MATYLLLFRGVGGKTQLPTGPLREALSAAGYESVGTYINSGNAYLRSTEPRASIKRTVAQLCAEKFGFEKDVYVVSLAEWRKLVSNNPYPDAAAKQPTTVHAAVLEKAPSSEAVNALRKHAVSGERIEVVGKVAYLLTPLGFGTSKFAARFDKDIGVPNTARNWNTVEKLLELAEKAGG
jgi:uncharacterized protein (DUF1697 family)